ncbi:HDOD domain-containing protein [uncultured Aquitalea sp.]|uniref:HDOD domain-containing protein n=1 Tax=uncultured Aquitalea sp. TaxID=540272 RepID=UPI0025DF2E8D|nr:HDOD domain-containing protein [uncultured Aquitalea sp.]
MELANWFSSISERRWPILPSTLVELKDACARHSDLISFTTLANVCLSDPFLLFDLLRVVGGSRALQRNESIPSVEQTLMLMGLEAVVNRFGKLTAIAPVEGKLDPEVMDAVEDWMGRSRVAALIVKEWLSISGEHKVEDCFVAALIYNLPACLYLIYRNQLPDKPLLQEVADAFNTDYSKLLEQFVKAIPLPAGLLNLLGSGAPNKRKQLLKLAMATANSVEQGWWRSPWNVGIDAAAKLIGATQQQAYDAVVQACLMVARQHKVDAYAYPARALLFCEGEYLRPELKKVAVLSASPEQLDQGVRESIRHLGNDLKFERILYYRYDHDTHSLRLKYQVGLAEGHVLRKLPLELDPGTFFALLTSKPQSFHAPDSVRLQLVRKYEDEFFEHIGDCEFAVMTLFAGHRLAGVFYVDNGRSNKVIDETIYHRFKELVARLSPHP